MVVKTGDFSEKLPTTNAGWRMAGKVGIRTGKAGRRGSTAPEPRSAFGSRNNLSLVTLQAKRKRC